MPGFTDLSRELIDNIISELIFLHDHDPAYQWTCLRTITPYHKSLIEHHFRHFWIPKLTFTIRLNERYENSLVSFTTQSDNQANSQSEHKELLQHHSDEYLTFERKEDYEEVSYQLDDDFEDWLEEVIVASQRSPGECEHSKSIIVRFGEGTLNKGFTHGGILNDVLVPGVTFDFQIDPWILSFDWKSLFDLLFDEEMQFRRFRDKLLEDFVPTIKKMTNLQARQAAIYKFLQQRYHWERRQMILAYREYMASQQLQPHAQPFDLTPYLPHQREIGSAEARLLTSDHFYEIFNQQSLVFQIPGWETWSVRDVTRLRIMDELIEEGMLPQDGMGYAGACYFQEMKVREEEMMGKREASEEVLEEYLRGPALDPRRFMDW